MAFVTIVTVDGKEYDLSKLKQRDENRCDVCGEFIAHDTLVNVAVTIYGQGIESLTRAAQAHPNHAIAAASDLAAELLAEAGQ